MFADTIKANPLVGPLKPALRWLRDAPASARALIRSLATPRRLAGQDRLHLGSGHRQIAGWANLDITGERNIIWDLRRPLPVAAGSIRFIYSEHFIEHITREDALRLLKNCRAVAVEGGVLRLSTPDLTRLVDDYSEGVIPQMDHTDWRPATLCRMVNEAMRMWGHIFVYDEAEMRDLLSEAGYHDIRRVAWGESTHPELSGLETRPFHGDLIMEAAA